MEQNWTAVIWLARRAKHRTCFVKGRHVSCAPWEAGVPIERAWLACCARTRKQHSDSCRRKPMPTIPFRWLAKVYLGSKAKTKQCLYLCRATSLCFCVSVYSFLTLSRISQAIDVLPVSWAFCENCLSVFCELFHSMVPAAQQWEPRAFHGAPGVATAFFGYFF